jgi:hypothetical protein
MPLKFWYDWDDGRVADATLVWILFFYIFLVDQPPLSQVAIPASHGLKPLTGAWVGTIVRGNPVRRPPKYWLPSRRGLAYFFSWFFPFLFAESQLQKIKHLSIPPFPLQSSGLLTELICCDLFLVLGFLLHSHASGFLNICYFWYLIFMIFL